MFSSINFLFLTSLAITSWVILCYLKHIEDQRVQELNVDFNMGRAFDESMGMGGNTTAACRGEGYEIYLNLLCVFACIYALAKITSLTEQYIIKHVHAKIPHQQQHRMPNHQQNKRNPTAARTATTAAPQSIAAQHKNRQEAKTQRVMLQMTYVGDEQEGEHCPNFLLVNGVNGKPLVNGSPNAGGETAAAVAAAEAAITAAAVNAATAAVKQQPNIFISNRHFHLNNRQIFVNEGNVRLHFQNYNKDDRGGGGGGGGVGQNAAHSEAAPSGDFTQIWQKYLEMQKYAIKKPTTPTATSAPLANAVPLVVSTEDLMRGGDWSFLKSNKI